MAVDDPSEINFLIPRWTLLWQSIFVVAGRRRLVAQPGGLTLSFVLRLVSMLRYEQCQTVRRHLWSINVYFLVVLCIHLCALIGVFMSVIFAQTIVSAWSLT